MKDKLVYKPKDIEKALKHCTTVEVCDGCPAFMRGSVDDCRCVLMNEALKYIRILKDLNRTLAGRIEALENGGVDA